MLLVASFHIVLIHSLLALVHAVEHLAVLHSWHAIFVVASLGHTLAIVAVRALSKHNDFVLGFGVLPASENKQMGTDSSRCVAESGGRRSSEVLALLPRHGVGRPDLEVIALKLSALVLETSTGGLGPAAEHDDIGTGDVHGVTESVLGRRARDSETSPDVSLSVEDTDVVEIAFLESSALVVATSALHTFIVEPETTVDDEVRADQNGAVTLTGRRSGTRSVRLAPCHHLEIKDKDIVEEVLAVPSSKDDHLGSVDEVG